MISCEGLTFSSCVTGSVKQVTIDMSGSGVGMGVLANMIVVFLLPGVAVGMINCVGDSSGVGLGVGVDL